MTTKTNKKNIMMIGLVAITLMWLAAPVSAQACPPYSVMGTIVNSTGGHPTNASLSYTLTNVNTGEVKAKGAVGTTYIEGSGYVQIDLSGINGSNCSAVGHVVTFIATAVGESVNKTEALGSDLHNLGTITLSPGPPTCSDGIKNGNEDGIDCGGTNTGCTLACYSLSASPSSVSETVLPNNTASTGIALTNAGKLALVGTCTLTIASFDAGNVTLSLANNTFNLTSTGNTSVFTLNINVSVNATVASYTTSIVCNATTTSVTIPVTLSTEQVSVRRHNYQMDYNVQGTLDGAAVADKCVDNLITITVLGKNDEPLEAADVDVYLGKTILSSNKVAYGETDANGNFSFTPAKEGEYTLRIAKSRYSAIDTTITVISCAEPTCSDGKKNQAETGVDCGGPCAACPTCSDKIRNQGETGVDCGGPCAACPTCSDKIRNQGETGVDCGGPCAACPKGAACSLDKDCTTGYCANGVCTEPTCSDGVKNQGETGVDCGGPCAACLTCSDKIKNQGETGVDCGGPCAACPPTETCTDGKQNQGETGVDCGGPCAACPPTETCTDGKQNQGETGVDCGGPCAACPGKSHLLIVILVVIIIAVVVYLVKAKGGSSGGKAAETPKAAAIGKTVPKAAPKEKK